VLDMIRMRMRAQEVRGGEPLSLEQLEERLERSAAVDEDRLGSRAGGDDVRVREPAGVQ
jgi:hypothetical protein